MLARLLQWLGIVAVVGLVGVGLGALAVVKDRVHVTIDADDAAARPDPLALVRDDLGQVHVDLRAIATGFDGNLGRLAEALAATTERLAGVTRALAEARQERQEAERSLAAALARVDAQLAALAAGTGAGRGLTAAAAPEPAPALASAAVQPPPAADTGAAPAPAEDPPPEPRRPSFLSFSLPSTSFAFDRAQHYRIVPSLSRVGFDAKSTLHDFTGVTSEVRGEVDADLAATDGAWVGEIACDAAALRTGVDGRDANMREHLDAAHHPQIKFTIERFVAAADGVDLVARRTKGEVRGKMTIRGVTRPVSMPVEIAVDASQRVAVSGQMPLLLSDYQVPVPSQLGLISMEDRVNVWVELRARSTGAAADRGHER